MTSKTEASRLAFLDHNLYEISVLGKEVDRFLDLSEYIYVSPFMSFIDRYNRLIEKYSVKIGINLDKFGLTEYDFFAVL